MRSTLLAALTAADLALAGVLGGMLLDERQGRRDEPAAVRPALDETRLAFAARSGDVAAYRETLERPLFVAARRPVAPQPAPAADADSVADPRQEMRLLGLYGSGREGGAVILHGDKAQRVRFGERIGGWTIVGAEGRTATLMRAGHDRRTLVMSLLNETAANAAPAAVPTRTQPASPQAPTDDQVEDR